MKSYYAGNFELCLFLYVCSFLATFLITVGEIIHGYDNPKDYFRSMENLYEVVAILSSWAYLFLFWFSDSHLGFIDGAELAVAAIAIFLLG